MICSIQFIQNFLKRSFLGVSQGIYLPEIMI